MTIKGISRLLSNEDNLAIESTVRIMRELIELNVEAKSEEDLGVKGVVLESEVEAEVPESEAEDEVLYSARID